MEPDFDRHRVREEARRAQSARHLARITEQDRGELVASHKISFESVLDRDRLGLPIRLDRAVVTGICQVNQGLCLSLADHLSELVERGALKIGNRMDANAAQ